MALFRRNINGWDVVAIGKHVQRQQPVPREDIIRRFYPGDPDDPDESDRRKNINDTIDFLIEADQIVRQDAGFELNKKFSDALTGRVAILRGLRKQEGENAAYTDVLETLVENNMRYFDHTDQLEDLMSGRRKEVSWNQTRLGFWVSMMATIGVIKRVNSDSTEDQTAVLVLEQDLLQELLVTATSGESPHQLRDALNIIHEEYLPIYSGSGRTTVADFMQDSLTLADRNGTIALSSDSDFGQSVDIKSSGYNSVSIEQEESA